MKAFYLLAVLCAVISLNGCEPTPYAAVPPKVLPYNPPVSSEHSVYGSSVVAGRVMATHVYKQADEILFEFYGHDQPLYTSVAIEGREKSIDICGDHRNAFKLGYYITIVLEDSPRSDYDGCFIGWKELQ